MADITQGNVRFARLMIARSRALEFSIDGIVITDPHQPDNPIIDVNPAFEELSGYSRDEIVGRNCRFLQGRDKDQSEINELRRGIVSQTPVRVVLRNYRKDGSLFWNELSVSPVFDEAGELIHYIGIQHDITARVEAEEALKQVNRDLSVMNTALRNQRIEIDELRRRLASQAQLRP